MSRIFYNCIPVLVLCTINLALQANASEVSGVKRATDCAMCHVDWMPVSGNAPPLVPLLEYVITENGRQKVSSTRRMCFSCHDGFVNDSRLQFRDNAHGHPVGVKPSSKVNMKKSASGYVYPLNEDGKMYCGTCHTAHSNKWNNTGSLFMRSNNKNSSLCIDCHQGKDSSARNHPLRRIEKQTADALMDKNILLGEKGQVICQTCHTAHNSYGKQLLVSKNKQSELCTICHDNKKQLVGSKHDLSKNKKVAGTLKGELVAKNGPCAGCHVSHGADNFPLLTSVSAKGVVEDWSQCGSCHSKGGIASDSEIGHFSHPTDMPLDVLGIDVTAGYWLAKSKPDLRLASLPLYDVRGKQVLNGGNVQCSTCHDPHGLIGDKKSVFLRMKQGKNSGLCTNCHYKNSAVINSKHNINLYDSERTAKLVKHNDSAEGVCAACHRTHDGDAPNMLTLNGAEESVSIIQTHCKTCHKEKGAAIPFKENTFNHPTLVGVRNPAGLPLFTLAGKRTEESQPGRLDCATCHNVHIWDKENPGLKGDVMSVRAHSGNSFLREPTSGDSKLCTGCHKQQANVIDTEHDYRVVISWLEHNRKQKNLKEGVCNQCHSTHNALTKAAIWGRPLGKSENVQASFCRSCHSNMNRISNKTVKFGKHPEHVLSWSIPKRTLPFTSDNALMARTPVFSDSGRREEVGIISCPSCHDPHQWRGSVAEPGSGRESEGGSVDSFLRNQTVQQMVCADCHGLDAIFRYQYFHSYSNTKKHSLFLNSPSKP